MELNQFRDVDVVLDKANDNIIQKQFVSAGDKDGRSLTVQLTDNGVIGEIIGAALNLYWHNQASGLTDLSAFYVVDRATSVFKIDYPQNMLTPGKVIAYIQIMHGGKVTHTKPFEITVQKLAGTTRGVLTTAEYGALVTTLAKANEFETDIAEVTAQLAHKVGGGKLASLNDFDEETLNFIHDGTGGPIQIESVPKDKSVTPEKTGFFKATHINLVDLTKITNPGVVDAENGTIITTLPNFFVTDYISVNEGNTYKTTPSYDMAWYDVNKTFIKSVMGGPYSKTLIAPANAKYMRLTFSTDVMGAAMVSKDDLPEFYTAYDDYLLNFNKENQKKGIADDLKPYLGITSSYKFSEWNAIGDSITEVNSTATTKYHDIIKQKTGVTVNNYGYSGTGYLQTYITFKAIWNRLDELSPTADLITVFAGTNDINQPLGVFGDTGTTTIYGGIDTVLQNLISKFPTKTIAVFTPLPRDNDWGSGSAGTTLEEIADAIIEVAGKYSIPVLDLYRTSNLHPWDSTFKTAMMPDGLHPNNAGHDKIADKIYAFLKKL